MNPRKSKHKKSCNWADYIYCNAFNAFWQFYNPVDSVYAEIIGMKIETLLALLSNSQHPVDRMNRGVSL
jgi:hypothetical protein